MGGSVCQQGHQKCDKDIIQDQKNISLNNSTFVKDSQLKLDLQNTKHPTLKKEKNPPLQNKIPDDPINLSLNLSSAYLDERQEPTTPALATQNVNQSQEMQHYQNIQSFQQEVVQTVKMNPTQKFHFSQYEDGLQQFKEQTSQYSKSYNNHKKQNLVNKNIVEDNLDDYIFYDWKNKNHQLIGVNDQHQFKKVAKPISKQVKKII